MQSKEHDQRPPYSLEGNALEVLLRLDRSYTEVQKLLKDMPKENQEMLSTVWAGGVSLLLVGMRTSGRLPRGCRYVDIPVDTSTGTTKVRRIDLHSLTFLTDERTKGD